MKISRQNHFSRHKFSILLCSYMILKNQKLHQQFSAEASSPPSGSSLSSRKPIFEGVSIFVDGYTVPSSQVGENFVTKVFDGSCNSLYILQLLLLVFCCIFEFHCIERVSFSRSFVVTCRSTEVDLKTTSQGTLSPI